MTPEQRIKMFYRLNGQLEFVKRRLGVAFGILRANTETGDSDVKALSLLDDSLQKIQNGLFDKYCR